MNLRFRIAERKEDQNMKTAFIASILLSALIFGADLDEHSRRIHESGTVLSEIMDAGDHAIPADLLRKATCVGVVPRLKRAGFIVGAKYGKGVITCRFEGTGWSAPSTIRIEGGSIGLQIGAGETDLVFIVMNKSGEEKLMSDKFTLGGDVSVMAGPIGRSANAETDAAMRAEILAYSRSHGVFAGVSLEGATLRPDNDDNAKIYGHRVTQREILHGEVTPPESASALYAVLNRYAPNKG
jgi:lipid-binding SYLF domain-containing protein